MLRLSESVALAVADLALEEDESDQLTIQHSNTAHEREGAHA